MREHNPGGTASQEPRYTDKRKVLIAASSFLALLLVGSSVLGYYCFHFDILTGDEWSYYDRSLLINPFHHIFLASRNGHRLVFPGLLQYSNLVFSGANLSNLVLCNCIAIGVSAWLLTRNAVQGLVRRSSRWLLTAAVMALFLWLGNRFAVNWAFGLTYSLSILGTVIACYCLARSSDPGTTASHWRWLLAALAGAMLSTFSWGSGVLIWPVLFLMALALRLSRTAILSILASGVLASALFFFTGSEVDLIQNSTPSINPGIVTDVTIKALVIIGNMPAHLLAPFLSDQQHLLSWFACIAGVLSLLLTAGLACIAWLSSRYRPLLCPLIGAVLFVIGTAWTAGFARWWLPAPVFLVPKYRIFSTLLWASLLCGYVPQASRYARFRRHPSAMLLVVVVCLLALYPSQVYDFMHAGTRKLKLKKASIAYALGITDDGSYPRKSLYLQHPEKRLDLRRYLQQHRGNIFSQAWTHWMGTSLIGAEHDTRQTPGRLVAAESVDTGWRIRGRMATAHPGSFIVGVNHSDHIRAIAIPTSFPDNYLLASWSFAPGWTRLLRAVDSQLPAVIGQGRGWYGYAKGPDEPHELRYFIVSPDKKIISRIE